ncbi:MAG: hypothetical protein KJ787_08995 [Gammaproteobacteria bacterium]|nr:hypothetical protein [Gammaproteobacteria bacterium]MBU1646457.1 hypothetical protein [Gammaproteobacteria bacterium]MBU1971000.1 hypothetical protein [Gammaproteobacteria bacterium]
MNMRRIRQMALACAVLPVTSLAAEPLTLQGIMQDIGRSMQAIFDGPSREDDAQIERAVPANQKIQKPALQTGDNWTYRRVDLWRNTEIERFRQDMLGGVGDHLTVLWTITAGADERRRGSVTREYLDGATLSFFDPKANGRHIPLLFPLYPGKRWSFRYNYPMAGGIGSLKIEQTAVVDGWENVRVAAGTFRALKVVHTGRYLASEQMYSWSGAIHETYWYAPDAKRVVRMEYRDTTGSGSKWDHWRDELVDLTVTQPLQRK